jgi:hypothetical protein
MLNYQDLRIVLELQHGDAFHEIGIRGAREEDAKHTVLISNCCSDGKVLPAIKDRALLLHNANYDLVLGLRDIHPYPSEDLEEIYELANEELSKLPLPCQLVIAVREIEAWFLKDHRHFQLVAPQLTAAFILERLGIDVETLDVEAIHHPAGQMNDIYGLVGARYAKTANDAHAIASRLDYEYLYIDAPAHVPSLKKFLDALNAAF